MQKSPKSKHIESCWLFRVPIDVYDLLHRDAALALTIAPENTKAYYWLIRSYQKQHMDEMAAGELAAAKQKLPEDEYQKLLNSLE